MAEGEGEVEQQGGGESSWREGLDEGIREHPALADFKDVPSLAKSFLETKEMVGRKGIILPKEGDDGDLARFRTEIGVPASPEEYDLNGFQPPEDLPWSENLQSGMLRKLHEIGIPNGQIRQILDGYAEVQGAEYQALQASAAEGHKNGEAALREELGAAYKPSMELCERAFKAAAGENFEALSHRVLPDGTLLGDHPAFVRTFVNVGKQMSEHGLLGEKSGGGTGFMMTPEAAKDEIAKIENNPALWDADNPEHAALQKRKDELYQMAYPEMKPEEL
jgi:hypothetical protein